MTTITAIDYATAILGDLHACLEAELDARGTRPCASEIVSGTMALPDCGCGTDGCGMAWVRLDRIYPSRQFPIPDNTPLGSCSGPLAAVIEVGVLRCVPVSDRAGNPPTDTDMTDAAIQAMSDTSAMLAALNCCEELTKRPHLLGTYMPRDAGDCGGGLWPVTVALRRTA